MQECSALMITATPEVSSSRSTRSAICSVIRSCTWGRRATSSTTRASLLKPGHPAVGNVRHVGLAAERQQVVLAHAGEGDVFDQHDFIISLGERDPQVPSRIALQAGEHLLVHPGDPPRRVQQSGPVRILPTAVRIVRTACSMASRSTSSRAAGFARRATRSRITSCGTSRPIDILTGSSRMDVRFIRCRSRVERGFFKCLRQGHVALFSLALVKE